MAPFISFITRPNKQGHAAAGSTRSATQQVSRTAPLNNGKASTKQPAPPAAATADNVPIDLPKAFAELQKSYSKLDLKFKQQKQVLEGRDHKIRQLEGREMKSKKTIAEQAATITSLETELAATKDTVKRLTAQQAGSKFFGTSSYRSSSVSSTGGSSASFCPQLPTPEASTEWFRRGKDKSMRWSSAGGSSSGGYGGSWGGSEASSCSFPVSSGLTDDVMMGHSKVNPLDDSSAATTMLSGGNSLSIRWSSGSASDLSSHSIDCSDNDDDNDCNDEDAAADINTTTPLVATDGGNGNDERDDIGSNGSDTANDTHPQLLIPRTFDDLQAYAYNPWAGATSAAAAATDACGPVPDSPAFAGAHTSDTTDSSDNTAASAIKRTRKRWVKTTPTVDAVFAASTETDTNGSSIDSNIDSSSSSVSCGSEVDGGSFSLLQSDSSSSSSFSFSSMVSNSSLSENNSLSNYSSLNSSNRTSDWFAPYEPPTTDATTHNSLSGVGNLSAAAAARLAKPNKAYADISSRINTATTGAAANAVKHHNFLRVGGGKKTAHIAAANHSNSTNSANSSVVKKKNGGSNQTTAVRRTDSSTTGGSNMAAAAAATVLSKSAHSRPLASELGAAVSTDPPKHTSFLRAGDGSKRQQGVAASRSSSSTTTTTAITNSSGSKRTHTKTTPTAAGTSNIGGRSANAAAAAASSKSGTGSQKDQMSASRGKPSHSKPHTRGGGAATATGNRGSSSHTKTKQLPPAHTTTTTTPAAPAAATARVKQPATIAAAGQVGVAALEASYSNSSSSVMSREQFVQRLQSMHRELQQMAQRATDDAVAIATAAAAGSSIRRGVAAAMGEAAAALTGSSISPPAAVGGTQGSTTTTTAASSLPVVSWQQELSAFEHKVAAGCAVGVGRRDCAASRILHSYGNSRIHRALTQLAALQAQDTAGSSN